MLRRLLLIPLIVLFLAAVGLFVSVPTSFAVDPITIACPHGQTVWLTGKAASNEALLVYLSGRAVGGGSADRTGSWRLPLRINERPGIYPVEVRNRASQRVLGRFSCYVNVALDNTVTPSSEAQAQPSVQPSARPSALPTLITIARSPTPTYTPTPATSTTATSATPSVTSSSGSAAGGRSTATPSATIDSSQSSLVITDVILSDPNYRDETDYVEIVNKSASTIDINGWRIVNATRGSSFTYTFPSFNVETDASVILFGSSGENNLEVGDFYWGRNEPVWRAGDTAELYNSGGTLVSRCRISTVDSTGGCVTS